MSLITEQRGLGRTVIFVSKNGSATGMMGIANPIRPEAVAVLNYLKADGVKAIHIVTGDNKEVAQTMMDIFLFDDCRAPCCQRKKLTG